MLSNALQMPNAAPPRKPKHAQLPKPNCAPWKLNFDACAAAERFSIQHYTDWNRTAATLVDRGRVPTVPGGIVALPLPAISRRGRCQPSAGERSCTLPRLA
jgi:hypothetical protein